MPTFRWTAPRSAEIPSELNGEIPLIDPKKDDPSKQVQEIWLAHAEIFDLSNDDARKRYEAVWQGVCNGEAKISEHLVNFVADKGTYVAFLRWSTFKYKVPSA